jgi:hypothetical protein
MAEFVTATNKTSSDLTNAKKRIVEVVARLENLQSPPAASSAAAGVSTTMRAEVLKTNENFAKFKEHLKEATKDQVTDSSASFPFMRKKKMFADPTGYPFY